MSGVLNEELVGKTKAVYAFDIKGPGDIVQENSLPLSLSLSLSWKWGDVLLRLPRFRTKIRGETRFASSLFPFRSANQPCHTLLTPPLSSCRPFGTTIWASSCEKVFRAFLLWRNLLGGALGPVENISIKCLDIMMAKLPPPSLPCRCLAVIRR